MHLVQIKPRHGWPGLEGTRSCYPLLFSHSFDIEPQVRRVCRAPRPSPTELVTREPQIFCNLSLRKQVSQSVAGYQSLSRFGHRTGTIHQSRKAKCYSRSLARYDLRGRGGRSCDFRGTKPTSTLPCQASESMPPSTPTHYSHRCYFDFSVRRNSDRIGEHLNR